MTNVLSPTPKFQAFDNNGRPLVNGKLFTYQATTNAKLATYQNPAGTPNTNPIILDFRGECNLWVPPNVAYKYVLSPATDTDPPTNPIWSIDNIVSSQLVTLYGGIDTGVSNAYVLNFTANFISYTDGIVIYWIPSNTNSTASTINVNGLGPVSIVNQNGSPLTSSQLVANQVAVIMYKGGQFLLISSGIAPSVVSGSFVPVWSGFGGSPPTGTIFYQKIGALVMLQCDAVNMTGVSTGTGLAITNLPQILRPQSSPNARQPCMVIDNGADAAGAFTFTGIIPASTIQFYKGTAPPNPNGFTAAGTKGLAPYQTLMWSTL